MKIETQLNLGQEVVYLDDEHRISRGKIRMLRIIIEESTDQKPRPIKKVKYLVCYRQIGGSYANEGSGKWIEENRIGKDLKTLQVKMTSDFQFRYND